MAKMIYKESVVNWIKFLLSILSKTQTEPLPSNFKYILEDQNRFAAWSNTEKGIVKCTLNTLKDAANELPPENFEEITNQYIEFETGWISLDTLRLEVIEELSPVNETKQPEEKPNKSSRKGLKLAVSLLENRITLLEQQNMRLTSLLSNWMGKTKKYAAKADKETQALFKTEMLEFQQRLHWAALEEGKNNDR
jgi:hypothetical protein